jgi:hypothetical protein
LLGQIVGHLQTTEKQLNPSELFIVLATCYLHDIGMQDLNIEGREINALGPDDQEFIRRRHPARAYDLIMQRAITLDSDLQFSIGLDCSPSCVKSIALVSQGHGTDFFENTLNEFAQRNYKMLRWPIRGDLLTALLLMADELDLHEERARLRPGMRLPSTSAMHHYIHLYVTSVQVLRGDTDKERCICIWFEYPTDSVVYVKTRRWLIGKLYRQCQITAPIIKGATNGELGWCERIGYHEVAEREKEIRPALPQRALLELERELVSRETVGYASELDTLKSMVLESMEYCTLCLISKDAHAKGQVIEWLKAHCASQGIWWLQFNLRGSATTPKDIPILMHKRLRTRVSAPKGSDRQQKRAAQFVESTPLAQLRDMIAKDLHQLAKRQRVVLVFPNVDSAATDTVCWLERDLVSKLAQRGAPLQVIMTYSKVPRVEAALDERIVLVTLGNFSKEDIIAQYRREFGFSEVEAEEKAQDMYKLTEGEPWRVILGFWLAREKRVRNLGEGKGT